MIYIDSINEKAISLLNFPFIHGLTTNPSIVKKETSTWGFVETVTFLQKIPGTHFVQGSVKKDKDWFMELHNLLEKKEIDAKKFIIKLPWDPSLAANYVLPLKDLGFKVCATAVYTIQQTFTAVFSNVDYIAFYYDRMRKSNIDVENRLLDILSICEKNKPELRLLGASIKDITTVNKLLKLGIHDLTLPLNVVEEILKTNFPQNDLEIFEDDFKL
ncbi:MAG: transaldolase family protein [Thermotogota bacterium]|jgi:transaldolase|nr:transaldolase family protein [Thermotogota bacterium]